MSPMPSLPLSEYNGTQEKTPGCLLLRARVDVTVACLNRILFSDGQDADTAGQRLDIEGPPRRAPVTLNAVFQGSKPGGGRRIRHDRQSQPPDHITNDAEGRRVGPRIQPSFCDYDRLRRISRTESFDTAPETSLDQVIDHLSVSHSKPRENLFGCELNPPKQFSGKVQALEDLVRILTDQEEELGAFCGTPCLCCFAPQAAHEHAHIPGDPQLAISCETEAHELFRRFWRRLEDPRQYLRERISDLIRLDYFTRDRSL